MNYRLALRVLWLMAAVVPLGAFSQQPNVSPAAAQPLVPLPADVLQVPNLPAAPVPQAYSYGTSSTTLLFLPAQIERMKSTIRNYESVGHDVKPAPSLLAPIVETSSLPTISEPASYPVFYVASIAYDRPGEWSLWVSGHKITSRRNDTDLTVKSISGDRVTLSWKPTYGEAVSQRRLTKKLAATDAVKNKLAGEQPVQWDVKSGVMTFTLRQNQSFNVGYDAIFEGFVESPKLEDISKSGTTTTTIVLEDTSETPPPVMPAEESAP